MSIAHYSWGATLVTPAKRRSLCSAVRTSAMGKALACSRSCTLKTAYFEAASF
jgi:hypothetical protein